MGSRSPDALGDAAAYTDLVRRRVLNVVGHALRTPVSTLAGLARAAESAPDQELRTEIVPALLRNVQRVEQLLDDLLIAAGITTALPVEAPEAVQVGAICSEVWNGLAEDRRDRPAPDLAVTGDAVVTMTPASFRIAIQHILRNARQYGESPVTVAVAVAVEQEPDTHTHITVDAPGPPMRDDEVACALEPFFRGDHAVTSAPGLGLGLSVARALIEQAGGALTVRARPGGGFRTRVELPRA